MSAWLKTSLLTVLTLLVAGCSGNDKDEDESFDPQPGGKCCEKQPEA